MTQEDGPRTLVVVGAASGAGRWLSEHLLWHRPWGAVVLVDTAAAQEGLARVAPPFDPPARRAATGDGPPPAVLEALAGADGADVATVLAVPRTAVADVGRWLAPALPPASTVVGVGAAQGQLLAAVEQAFTGHAVAGLHPLFDVAAPGAEGQTFLLVDPVDGTPAPSWLAAVVRGAGGIPRAVPVLEHDAAMASVQALSHQALVAFARALTASPVPLDHLWAHRTPTFEALLGLAVRALAEPQQATVADIQLAPGASASATSLRTAVEDVVAAVEAGAGAADGAAVEALVASTRNRFSGALFDVARGTAASAVNAVQAKRADLARRARTGEVVGLRVRGRRDDVRVGRIVEVSPTAVTVDQLLVGRKGSAALLEGAGARNAARVGRQGRPTRVELGLGHVELVTGPELDDVLDGWLARIRRDVRFLVPESVAGSGVLHVVATDPDVREASLTSEVVRTGQRSVVVRVHIRVDVEVDDVVERLRAQVDEACAWPLGLFRSAPAIERVHYLGPAGTFSEVAARQVTAGRGLASAALLAEESFDAVLASLGAGSVGLLPLTSSASGLVGRAVGALLDHDRPLEAAGVVDVAVRFDAYVHQADALEDARGAAVYSHPQALDQCRRFLERWSLQAVPCSSTTEALQRLAEADGPAVALAGADAPLPPGVKVAEREVDDLSGSITRFVLLGPPGTFGELVGGSDPTLRSLVVARSLDALVPLLVPGAPAYDELLVGADGTALLVTSRTLDEQAVVAAGARPLGQAPWSPRTPVVRVDVGAEPPRS